jgi:ABC-2 type transport system ATP-binding protein
VSLALEIRDLDVQYESKKGKSPALQNLNLTVERGEFFGLLGPNGAGKSSAIHAITRLVKESRGEVKVFGEPAGSMAARRKTGFVPQEIVNHGYFRVDQILRFYSGMFGLRQNEDRLGYLSDRLELKEHLHKKMSQLSGGMKRRVMIAKALLHSPELLLLDEPSAGVDVELRRTLWDFCRELNRLGTTIVLTTHYLEEAEELCGRIAILNKGKLIALDKTKTLIETLSRRSLRFRFLNQRERPTQIPSEYSWLESRDRDWCVSVPQALPLGQVMNRLGIRLEELEDVRVEEGALEDAFLRLVGQERSK